MYSDDYDLGGETKEVEKVNKTKFGMLAIVILLAGIALVAMPVEAKTY